MPVTLIGRTNQGRCRLAAPASASWQVGVERLLGTLSDDARRIERPLSLTRDRLAGRLPRTEILAGAGL